MEIDFEWLLAISWLVGWFWPISTSLVPAIFERFSKFGEMISQTDIVRGPLGLTRKERVSSYIASSLDSVGGEFILSSISLLWPSALDHQGTYWIGYDLLVVRT